VQKYEHFSNWQNIFYHTHHSDTLSTCIITTTSNKYFFFT